MPQRSLEILNERLAKGELSIDEYELLKSKILTSNKLISSESNAKPEYVAIDKKTYQAPSNYSPITIEKNLTIAGDHLIFEGKNYSFQDITHLVFNISKTTFNFVPTTHVYLSVLCNNHKIFSITSSGIFINKNKRINMIICGVHLENYTRKYRFDNIIYMLNKNKYVDIDGIKFFCNGNVVKGSTTLNILKENNQVNIEYGRLIGGSYHLTLNNPDFVKFTERQKTGMFRKKITFSMSTNKDLTRNVIQLIRNGEFI